MNRWIWGVACIGAAAGLPAHAAENFGYDGDTGPANWSRLDAKYVMCALGRNQAPIDLAGSVEADLKPLKLAYKVGPAEFVNMRTMEGHLVHADQDGNLAVVSVMFNIGAANAVLAKAWGSMPAKAGDKAELPNGFDVMRLLPASKDYFRFNGSLTTPPCSEGVRWMVMKKPVTASKAQIEQFTKTIGFANNRPVQPLNARDVLK
jgi:carbonic anhydrase